MDRWYVVSTHPLKEERARDNLLRQGFEVYLPRCIKRRSHARKVEFIPAPLFPRYLFVGFDIDFARWRSIQSTIGVSHIVCNGGMPLSLPDGIVDGIRASESENGLIEIKPAFIRGQPVVIGAGPFLDQIGLFDRMSDNARVTILLSLLGREVRVKMPIHSVRAVA